MGISNNNKIYHTLATFQNCYQVLNETTLTIMMDDNQMIPNLTS